ncbi:acyl-CoA-binding protein [Hymenobacter guriensis]|uniref:Acyl-CoA-binding protein n=1 Tax=Hymenobacter guriensis TaxID=2793065 RepID=A0ABS0KYM3_9BACT|nr:acyl-CoA-binding protein [Hymenobacter guriensis]MBG8552299.1 acyl-CoA-binding protein [Hymenobacter guriensis]
MNLQQQPDLQQQFEAAVSRVDSLPGDKAAPHMHELYGLYKQATEGDHDTKREEVGDDTPDNPNGPQGLSQAQWDAWSKFKGVSQEDARRQYVEKVEELAGQSANTAAGSAQPTSSTGTAPAPEPNEAGAPGIAKAPFENLGGASAGGLRGDINAGAPYGGEDLLKTQQ